MVPAKGSRFCIEGSSKAFQAPGNSCCWALMLALLGLGMMNLALMAAFAIAIFVEKIWRYGIVFAVQLA